MIYQGDEIDLQFKYSFNNKEIILYSWSLCNYEEYGDYEIFPSESLDIDLKSINDNIIKNNISVSLLNDKFILFIFENTEITLYTTGRAVLEHVAPDTHEKALEIYCLSLKMRSPALNQKSF